MVPQFKKDFLFDALKYLPSVIAPSIAGVLLVPILTRIFNTEEYGHYTLAMATLSFAQTFFNAWLSTTIIRFYAASELRFNTTQLISTVFVITLVSSVTGAALLLLGALALESRLDPLFFKLLAFLPLFMLPSNLVILPMQVSRAARRIFAYNVLSIAKSLLVPATGIAVSLAIGGKVIGMIIGGAALSWLLVPLAYGKSYGLEVLPRLQLFESSLAKRLISFGVPMISSYLLVQILEISDRFIIYGYRGSSEAGIYAANYSMAVLPVYLITALVTGAAGPLVVSIWENKGRYESELFGGFLTRIYLIISIPAFIGLAFLSKDVMSLLSTDVYVDGAKIFPFVTCGAFLVGLQWIAQRGLQLANKTREIFIYYFMAGVVNIVFNILLVPKYGYIAAAWSTLITYLFLLIIIATGASRVMAWHFPYSTTIRSTISSSLMIAVLYFLPERILGSLIITLTLKVLAGTLTYGCALVLLREVQFSSVFNVLSGKEFHLPVNITVKSNK